MVLLRTKIGRFGHKKKGLGYSEPPCLGMIFLVNQRIILRAKAWECGACATADDWFAGGVAALGYNLKNVYFRSRIAQNIFLHSSNQNLMVKLFR